MTTASNPSISLNEFFLVKSILYPCFKNTFHLPESCSTINLIDLFGTLN